MAKILMWGACTITVTPLENSGATLSAAVTFNAPAEAQTTLTPTQGTKQEARIEGGEVEAVRYQATTYQLTWRERVHSTGKTDKFGNGDGNVPGEFSVAVTPTENNTAPVLNIARASANVQYEYNATDGGFFIYTVDVLKPASGSAISFT